MLTLPYIFSYKHSLLTNFTVKSIPKTILTNVYTLIPVIFFEAYFTIALTLVISSHIRFLTIWKGMSRIRAKLNK